MRERCKAQGVLTPQNVLRCTRCIIPVIVDKKVWKVHRPFPRLVWKARWRAWNCSRLHHTVIFIPPNFISAYWNFFWSAACHRDALRLKLARSMQRSTVEAFLMKFGISGGRTGNDEEGRGGRPWFSALIWFYLQFLLLLSWTISIS